VLSHSHGRRVFGHVSEYDQNDTSDYDAKYFLHSKANAKVIGKFKDESNAEPPLEFVGLRSKMYSLLLPGDYDKKNAKGVKMLCVAKYIRHADYVQDQHFACCQ
jgi:hypothetical protein